MGKQFSFLMDEEIEKQFTAMILEDGKILWEGNNMEPEEITALPERFCGRGWFQVYLYKKEFGLLQCTTLDTGRKFIDSIVSPVIEYTRTIVRKEDKELSRGRLWMESKYFDDQGNLIKKSSEIEFWYRGLAAWIRKNLNRVKITSGNIEYIEYISPSLLDLVNQGFRIK